MPASAGKNSLTGSYNGDTNHATSSGHKDITATTRSSTLSLHDALPILPVNSSTSCTVTVSDTDAGSGSTPSGSVSLSQSPAASGSFSGSKIGRAHVCTPVTQ